jgi:hypothetical protein
MSPEEINEYDAMDRRQIEEEDRAARLAQNEQIDAYSSWRERFDSKMKALEDSINHFGEDIDDRQITKSARRQELEEEAAERAKAAAAARARAARLRAQQNANMQALGLKVGTYLRDLLTPDAPIYVEGKGSHEFDELFAADKLKLVHLLSPAEFERQRNIAISKRDAYYKEAWTSDDYDLLRENNNSRATWDYIHDMHWRKYIDAEYTAYLRDENRKFEANNRLQDAAFHGVNAIAYVTGAAVAVIAAGPALIDEGLVGFLKTRAITLGKSAIGSTVAAALTSSGGPDGGFGSVAGIAGGFVGGGLGGRAGDGALPKGTLQRFENDPILVTGQATRAATEDEIARYEFGMSKGGREVGYVEYNDGSSPALRLGDTEGVKPPSGPNVDLTWHSHPDSPAIFSGGDVREYFTNTYAPDVVHSVTGPKWPLANVVLRQAGLEADTALVTTEAAGSLITSGAAEPHPFWAWLRANL